MKEMIKLKKAASNAKEDDADVFSKSIDPPWCTSVSYDCLKNFKKSTKYTCSQLLRTMPGLKALSN